MPIFQEVSAHELKANLPSLTTILHACVHAGASVGFVVPFTREEAQAFWQETVFPAVRQGRCHLFVAMAEGECIGTVQLGLQSLPNQVHRCDVSKLLVHPDHRRQGIARHLMVALENKAQALGKRLLTLDTRTGDNAEPLYRSLGFETAGIIPGYCLSPDQTVFEATTYMYKDLSKSSKKWFIPALKDRAFPTEFR